MKRWLSLVVLFCFTTNVFASTGSVQALEKLIDEHTYTMTVEWDQKDKAFQDQETAKFLGSMRELMQNQDLSTKDVESLVEKKVTDHKAFESLRLKLALQGVDTAEEFLSYVQKNQSDFYVKGASWNASTTVGVIMGTLVVGFFGLMLLMTWNDARCLEYKDVYSCRDTEVCSGGGSDGIGESCTITGKECDMFPECQRLEDR